MTTQDSTQAGGQLERLWPATEMFDLKPIGYAETGDILRYEPVLTIGTHLPGVRDVAMFTKDQLKAAVAHERNTAATHASQQAAVVAGLAEASAEPLRLLGSLRVAMHWPELEAQMKDAEAKLRAALAAYHAMKEKT